MAAARVLALHEIDNATVVALYAAIGAEMHTDTLARELDAREIKLAYPRIIPGQRALHFHRVTRTSELIPGPFRTLQPSEGTESVPLEQLDVVVIPGLAFDRQGNRLGWGQGYYDATLRDCPNALRIGYAHACQVVDELPHEPHDIPMDLVITDQEVIRFGARTNGPEYDGRTVEPVR